MKKIFLCIVSFLVAFVICGECIKPLALNYDYGEDEESPIFLGTAASIYFSNLSENYPRNQEGSCGYSALAMLLSYYDSFYSDEFVDERYDQNCIYYFKPTPNVIRVRESPGVRREPYSTDLEDTYYEFIQQHDHEYLQLKLITLGTARGINFLHMITSDYGLFNTEMVNLLQSYLYNYRDFSGSQVSIRFMYGSFFDENKNAAVYEQMVYNVSNGIPTIYTAQNGLNAHCLIAYDYDSTTQNVYFHTGWSDPDPRIVSYEDLEYKTYPVLIWIEIDESFEHSCSNNYIERNTDVATCTCRFAFHPEHTHTLTGVCSQNTSLTHVVECSFCNGYEENHINVYNRISATEHRVSCICGRTTTEIHMAKRGENSCMMCGALLSPGFNGPIILGFGGAAQTMDMHYGIPCDTYLSETGIIILSENDYDLFIVGEITIEDIYGKVGLVYE